MKKSSLLILYLLIPLMCAGCLYSHIKLPFDTNLDETQLGSKKGEATWRGVMWLVSWGDASTDAAAKQGGLTTINHMDQEIITVLFGLYTSQTTVVYGD